MTHNYQISGITCGGCEQKVETLLQALTGVTSAKVNNDKRHITVSMQNHISTVSLNQALAEYPQYRLVEDGAVAESFWENKLVWKKASANTINCLVGCSIGDFGMIIYLQTYHPNMNMFLMMGLAMLTGLTTSVILETVLLHIKEKFNWLLALKTAFSMSFISMLAMEFAENTTDFMLTGGQVSTSHYFYWVALGISLVAGFIVPLPYNYYKLKKYGKACH